MGRLRSLGRGGRLLLALAVGGALFGIATAVQADIPDAGVIHGCYKNNGQLRVIDSDSGQSCAGSEVSLAWNQRGVTGSTGKRGPTGAAGSALGYAYVAQDGTLLDSKGVVQVTHPDTGVWCFGLTFAPDVAVATVTGFAGLGNQIIHTSISPNAGDACTGANPTDAAAFMVLPDGTRTDYQFFIEFN